MRILVIAALCSGLTPALTSGQQGSIGEHKDIQQLVFERTPTALHAVIEITATLEYQPERQNPPPISFFIIGTGFLVNDQGDFVTAAHVTNTKEINGIKVALTANTRSRAAFFGEPFTIVETDTDHDLVLCHLDNFHTYLPADSPTRKTMAKHLREKGAVTLDDVSIPFASFTVAKTEPKVGQFILVSGYPLLSWSPVIHFGMVASTQTRYPKPESAVVGVPKDTSQLLQIAVTANHGDSGGPVINLSTGEVIGVILNIVPAPLALNGKNEWSEQTYDMSGLMLAAPWKWVNALLARNNVKNKGVPSGKFLIN